MVTKVHELVNVAKINPAVAETVVHIMSNVMVSADKPAVPTSNRCAPLVVIMFWQVCLQVKSGEVSLWSSEL